MSGAPLRVSVVPVRVPGKKGVLKDSLLHPGDLEMPHWALDFPGNPKPETHRSSRISHSPQRLQYPLSMEYTLNLARVPIII